MMLSLLAALTGKRRGTMWRRDSESRFRAPAKPTPAFCFGESRKEVESLKQFIGA